MYKSSRLSPKPSRTYFQPREHFFQVLQWQKNSPFDVSTWIRKLGPDFKDSINPYGLSCTFPYHQIMVDELLLCVATSYWVPSWHVFRFNGIELCPTIKEFVAIMGEPKIDDFIFLTMGRDLPSLLQVLLGIPSITANKWCVFGKLSMRLGSNEKLKLFHQSAYFCYYSWAPLHFLVLFIGPIVLFQLTFTFIYSTFSNKFSVSAK